jgi:uncharacterized membrane protein YbhN (UPF0104 family)
MAPASSDGSASAPATAGGRDGIARPRLIVVAAFATAAFVVGAVAAGWDAGAWLRAVWDSLSSVSLLYLVPALALQTLQTVFAAAAWHGILRYAYPETEVRYVAVLACCATGVAINSVTPANAGTVVTVLMFVAVIPAATVAGVAAAAAVEKLFYAVVGVLVAVALFLTVGGSFERKFGFLSDHPWAVALAAVAVVALVAVGGRLAWRRLKGLWEQARQGGRILSDRRAYVTRVLVPQLLSYCCKLAVVAVLLAAYGIPVGVRTVVSVVGGNSIAGLASLTPGGVGVTQAFNVASLHEATDAATAGAYSIGNQLLTTAWNIVVAAVVVAVAFGRAGGRRLVAQASAGAKDLHAERSEASP